MIGLPFLSNAVLDNIVEAQTGTDNYAIAILFYGMSFRNRGAGNTVRMRRTRESDLAYAMQISSLSAVNGAGSFVSGSHDQRAAPCVDNLLEDNRLYDGDLLLNYNDFGGGTTPYVSELNRTAGNVIYHGVRSVSHHTDLSDGDTIVP